MKFIHVGDPHFCVTSPKNRVDDIKEVIIDKMHEIYELCKQHKAECLTLAGDIFNSPQVSVSTLLFVADLAAALISATCNCP